MQNEGEALASNLLKYNPDLPVLVINGTNTSLEYSKAWTEYRVDQSVAEKISERIGEYRNVTSALQETRNTAEQQTKKQEPTVG